ncbi:hypothetical protein V1511DRAFT_509241 [Dipodascopsis uninucleata]
MSAKRSAKPSWSEPPPSIPIPGYNGFALGLAPPVKQSKRERKVQNGGTSITLSASSTPDQRRSPTRSSGSSERVPKSRRTYTSAKSTPVQTDNSEITNGESSMMSDVNAMDLETEDGLAVGSSEDEVQTPLILDTSGNSTPPDTETSTPVSKTIVVRNTSRKSKVSPESSQSPDSDVHQESKIKLKFQKRFDDYCVKSSVLRHTAKTLDDNSTENIPRLRVKLSAQKSEREDDSDSEKVPNKRRLAYSTPPPESEISGSNGKTKRQRRIKISPMKNRKSRENVFGFGAPPDLTGVSRSATGGNVEADDPSKYNDDFCSACGGIGRFLCCEGCPRSFHFTCADPPIDEDNLPEDSWFCKSCYTKRHPPLPPPRGLFSELLDQMQRRNPSSFSLPKELRERYEGVTTTDFGEYQDVNDLKPRRINRSGFIEEVDPYKLQDKHGNPILCYTCGKSAMGERQMISCDYCPLHWHLDCLTPPMVSIPTSLRKWMCPNHVGRDLVRRRRKRSSKIVDVSLRRGFINNGDIEVGNDSSEEDPESINENFVKPSVLHFVSGWQQDGYRNAFDRRVVFEEMESSEGVVYKIPERGIVLDFLDRVNLLPHSRKHREPAPSLSELDRLVERPYQEREFVRNATYLNQSHTEEALTRQKVAVLLDAANKIPIDDERLRDDSDKAMTLLSPASSSDLNKNALTHGENSPMMSTTEPLTNSELKESLTAIRKIIEIKGRKALLDFLSS